MRRLIHIWLMAILSLPLYAEEIADTLEIALMTESPLIPLYLLPFSHHPSHLSAAYVHQLEQILAFDLNHNGSTCLVKRTTDSDQIGQKEPLNQSASIAHWKSHHIFYVIKGQVQEQKLNILMLDIQESTLKSTPSLSLTGNLKEDRQQIHRLADTIHKALFGKEGIASTHILYTLRIQSTKDSNKWISEVWEADYDGGNAHPLTHDNSYCVTPTYIPPKPSYTSGGFLYVSYQLGQPKIYIAPLKGGHPQRLTYLKGNQFMPAVSKQRDRVAFISDVTGNPDLFLQPFSPELGAIGKPQQIFSARQATQGSPTFSPDGKRIAFVSNKDGSPKIYTIDIPPPGANLSEIKATLISKCNRENSAPAWSPDGTKLAYCARTQGERQIWIYDFNTNQEKQLTQGAGHKENPSWAPDSLHLVFNSADHTASELFLINLNQPEPQQITFGPGEKRFPSWESR